MTRTRKPLADMVGEPEPGVNGVHGANGQQGAVPDLVIPPAAPRWPAPPSIKAYHGLAGDVATRIEPETEADPVAILVQFLVAFGNVAGRVAYCQVGRRRHHGNLFCVLVGRTSYGGKGESWGWIDALFKSACSEWHQESIMGGLSSGEGLIKVAQDVREEAGRRVLAVEEEFGAVLHVMAREHSTLSAVLRQGWDGGRLRVMTRNNPLRVDDAHISVIGHVTPQELKELLSQTDSANGFANRMLWVMVRRSKLLPEGGTNVDMADLEVNTRDAVNFAHGTQFVGRDQDARALWHGVYERLKAERPGVMDLVATRAVAQVLRLSLIYALLDRSRYVTTPHLEAALALWDYCERSAAHVFGVSSGDVLADQIMEALGAAGQTWLSQTDLHRLVARHKSAADIARALGILQAEGLVECRKSPTGGRPTLSWKKCEKSEKSATSPPSTTCDDTVY